MVFLAGGLDVYMRFCTKLKVASFTFFAKKRIKKGTYGATGSPFLLFLPCPGEMLWAGIPGARRPLGSASNLAFVPLIQHKRSICV